MNPVTIIPAITIVLLSLLTVSVLNRWFKMQPPAAGRYVAIDGLRGYLAFFVFLHHADLWYYRRLFNLLMQPPSRLYTHFGPTSVSYFFMITAFLFISKLIHAKDRRINWQQLYLSRIFRIMPLYLFAMLILFLIVARLSHFTLHQPWWQVAAQLLGWIGFMQPDINQIGYTWKIIAGVTWSLSYEWLFYSSLPFWWAWLLSKATRWYVLLGALIAMAAFTTIILIYFPRDIPEKLTPFTAGIVTAFLIRNPKIQRVAKSIYASVMIPILLAIVVLFYHDSLSPVPYLCNWLIFIAIAGGNTLFGLLSHKASFLLGQISYSLYLLHGLLLFSLFRFIPGIRPFATQSPVIFWSVIAVIGILLTVICTFTFYYIEQPGINAMPRLTAKPVRYRVPEVPAP